MITSNGAAFPGKLEKMRTLDNCGDEVAECMRSEHGLLGA
jgi:hypothetical protein